MRLETDPAKSPQVCAEPTKPRRISSVLYVKGLDPLLVSIYELVSLFELYGKVEMAVIHKMKDFALIKYKDQDSASRGMRYLNKVCLHGRKISIFFSKYVCIEERRFHN